MSGTKGVHSTVYNEERHLGDFIKYLMASPCPIEREIIFVDDKSVDGSLEIMRQFQKEFGFLIIEQEENRGKGAAVVRGILASSGSFIMIQDADFEYDPGDVPELLRPLIENCADVVFGSRFKKNSLQVHRTYHYFVNRFLTFLSNLFSGIYLTDMETCYKIFRSDLLKSMNLTSKRFGIEVELTAYVAKTSARVFELPINYYPRTTLQGKKINWKDGVAAVAHILRYNLRPFSKCFTDLPARYHPSRSRFEIFRENKGL